MVVAVLVVIVVGLGGGSSSPSPSANGAARSTSTSATHAPRTRAKASGRGAPKTASAARSAAETNVVVLNGTSTSGLAHRVSGELRGGGYSRATPLNGRPPGANQATVVEYTSGHRADAERVARALGGVQVQAMEATVASLSGSATVAVIVGLDKAATVP